jgi:thiamine pyrophosphate-dependent acetolactate synthase large subunit-like protein
VCAGSCGPGNLHLINGLFDANRSRVPVLAIAATVDKLAAADAVFTADVGTPCIWTARYVRMNGTRRLIGSFIHGSMANALSHAIGAQASHPGRQIIALAGDGGLAMLLGELLTLRQQRLPVKIVVFNNGALSFVELEMKAAGIPTFATDLVDPDFTGIARSAGLFGVRVEKASELDDALRARRSTTTAPPSSTSLPPGRSYHCRPASPTGRSRASPCTRPGPFCPAKDQNSSSSPGPTCGNWRSSDPCFGPRGAARAGAVHAAARSP